MMQKRRFGILGLALFALLASRPLPAAGAAWPAPAAGNGIQFIVVNGIKPTEEAFREIATVFSHGDQGRIRIGVGFILSYFSMSPTEALHTLEEYLRLSAKYAMPVVVQLDGEQWWGRRPDLWNWWAPDQPGYDPANRRNVEWTGWTPDSAVRIGWRNWGRQLRVQPMPNLMSPAYREACHRALERLVPVVVHWWRALPPEHKDLLIGLKMGWESAIGVNNWYYPGGNDLLERPERDDPSYGLQVDSLPGRGVQAIGYAAVSTLGLAQSGPLREAQLTEVVRRHLYDLCRLCDSLGVPRDRLFTHAGGWSPGETLYTAALNPFACPGWSFYDHAADPRSDRSAMAALRTSDAPYWGAVEWLYSGRPASGWYAALRHTLRVPRLRYLCIYNWSGIRDNPAAIAAIARALRR